MTMTEAKTSSTYQLPGNPAVPVTMLGNLLYDERGQEAFARLNEAFKGRKDIEDKTQYQPGQPLAWSNTPRNLFSHQFLQEKMDGMSVQSPIDMIRFWNSLLERDTTYADSNAVTIFPAPGPNEDLRTAVLKAFGKTATLVPLLVSGLKPVKADNDLRFTLERTDYAVATEAPWLTKDQRVKYDAASGNIVPAQDDEAGVQIYVPEDQSGLRGAFRGGGYVLYFGDDRLLNSSAGGRVPVKQDPKGRAENLDALVAALKAEQARQITEANARFEKAKRYMQTGQF